MSVTDPAYWLERAAAACGRIAGGLEQGWARLDVARGYLHAGDPARAREQLERARAGGLSVGDCSETLSLISEIESAEGNMAGALDAALKIDEAPMRSRALGRLSLARARSGDFVGALAIVERIDRPLSKIRNLLEIASLCRKKKDYLALVETIVRVRTLLPRIEDAKERARMAGRCNRMEAAPAGAPKASAARDFLSTGRLKEVLSTLPPEQRPHFQAAYLGLTLEELMSSLRSKDKRPLPSKSPDLLSLLERFWAGDLDDAGRALEEFLGNGAGRRHYLRLLFKRLLARGGTEEDLERWAARVSALEPESEFLVWLDAASSIRALSRPHGPGARSP
jgi:hypothetical protein